MRKVIKDSASNDLLMVGCGVAVLVALLVTMAWVVVYKKTQPVSAPEPAGRVLILESGGELSDGLTRLQ